MTITNTHASDVHKQQQATAYRQPFHDQELSKYALKQLSLDSRFNYHALRQLLDNPPCPSIGDIYVTIDHGGLRVEVYDEDGDNVCFDLFYDIGEAEAAVEKWEGELEERAIDYDEEDEEEY